MSSNNSEEISSDVQPDNNRLVIFWTYLFVFIVSIICSCLIFIQFILKRILKHHIQYHVIFVILIFSFLQVTMEHPILFSYLYNGILLIQSDNFCKFWLCLEFFFNGTILMLMCYGSIERYLFIFHRNLIHHHLILLHYFPIIFFVLYPFILYIGLICFYPCVNQFDYTMIICGGPCYLYEPILSAIDTIVDLALPLGVCTIANILLLVRVLRQKHRMRQQHLWKKNRRLVIQLLSIVILHNIVWFPVIICLLIIQFSPVSLPIIIDITINRFPFGYYMVVMLCPFVLLIGLPELWPLSFFNNTIRPTANNPIVRTL